jgi:hypothetical protein
MIWRRRLAALLGWLALPLALGCWRTSPRAPLPPVSQPTARDWFERAPASGLEFTYHNGEEAERFSILETVGGGVGLVDFDQDGRLDGILPGGGKFTGETELAGMATGLFRQLEAGAWSAVQGLALRDDSPAYSHGIAAADVNSDGFPDLLITGFGRLQLWMNQGDGTFLETAQAAGLTDSLWSTSAAWLDLNADGLLDLYVCHYLDWSLTNNPECRSPRGDQRDICTPHDFGPLPDMLYLNAGDGTFRDVSTDWGLRQDSKGLGVVAGDIDNDGDTDLYVGNDAGANFLYLNQGTRFQEVGEASGTAFDDQGLLNGTMGVDLADFNRDGLFDLWAANYEHEPFGLYRNFGHGQFAHVSKATGVTALGGLYVGFGTLFGDFDHDGDEDLVVANGHVLLHPAIAPRRQRPLLLRNDGGRFTLLAEFAPESYFRQELEGRGLAAGDVDRDGDLDLVISHQNEPAALLQGTIDDERWFQLRLIGITSNRDGIGARVALHTSQGDLWRQVKGGGSYESQSSLVLHWGIPPNAELTSCTIHWPSGKTQSLPAHPGQLATAIERP